MENGKRILHRSTPIGAGEPSPVLSPVNPVVALDAGSTRRMSSSGPSIPPKGCAIRKPTSYPYSIVNLTPRCGCQCSKLKVNTRLFLKTRNNLEQVPGVRVSRRAEHPHQALGRVICDGRKFMEANGGVDVVAQYSLSGFHIPCKKALHSFTKKLSAESGIPLHSGANGFFEIPCQSHYLSFSHRL